MNRQKRTGEPAKRGFTAIEISMVVTVIAILALLILPLFRDRVEAARRAAAQDEMQTLMKAEVLAYADTRSYFRLQDLDNTTEYNDPPLRPDQEVPIAQWNRPFSAVERARLRPGFPTSWKGPYISMGRFKYMDLQSAVGSVPEFFWSNPGRGGPIMDLQPGVAWVGPLGPDSPDDKVLIDPWGTPYLFFGTGKLNEEGGAYTAQESSFGNAAIYCLGTNGTPGNQLTLNAQELLREFGIIGTGDDFVVFF